MDILNGPFSAEYGDFSGLGVAHIRLKETLPNLFTARLQGGSFGAVRAFVAYSPQFDRADSFIAYEGTHTDGPFISPLRYQRDNVTGNYTWHISEKESLGFKLNFGRNDFFSSGQIPLDLVADGQLDRFGYVDPFDGGRVRLGTLGIYYRRDLASGDIFKVDGFLTRNSGPRTIWSLPNAFTSAFKGQDPVPQFKATAKWGNSWSRFSQSFQPAGRCRSAAYSQFAQLLLTINSGLMRDVTINFGWSRS